MDRQNDTLSACLLSRTGVRYSVQTPTAFRSISTKNHRVKYFLIRPGTPHYIRSPENKYCLTYNDNRFFFFLIGGALLGWGLLASRGIKCKWFSFRVMLLSSNTIICGIDEIYFIDTIPYGHIPMVVGFFFPILSFVSKFAREPRRAPVKFKRNTSRIPEVLGTKNIFVKKII